MERGKIGVLFLPHHSIWKLTMDAKDGKIRLEVLKVLYEAFESDPTNYTVRGETIKESIDGVDSNDIDYILDRMDGEFADVDKYPSLRDVEILAKGIEFLDEQGFETILGTDSRYEILEAIYLEDRNKNLIAVGMDAIKEETGLDEDEIIKNLRYLKHKRCIKFYSGPASVKITESGRERWEKYRDEGVGIPSSSRARSTRQEEIGDGEREKAERLFRSIVELAQNEVVILDNYARKPLFVWLESHVPDGVNIRVATTGAVTGGSYVSEVRESLSNVEDIEIREMADFDEIFHDRYVFRDNDMGWEWGQSFHGSGKGQHTPSELTPKNRDILLQKFEDTWVDAEEVL